MRRHGIPRCNRSLAALVLCTPFVCKADPAATAHAPTSRLRGRLVEVRIIVDGSPAPLYSRARGDNRHYFEAMPTAAYGLELRNRSEGRVGVLIAVDGLNVITGTRSDLGAHESMYVLGPRERVVIRGWRTSLDDVRRFVFVDEERSYAARSGQANTDLGRIHVLAFEERTPVRMSLALDRWGRGANDRTPPPTATPKNAPDQARAPEGPGRSAETAPERAWDSTGRHDGDSNTYPGTGWGARQHDAAQYTTFDPIESPADRWILRYEYESGLRALGVLPAHGRLEERDAGDFGFARPPHRSGSRDRRDDRSGWHAFSAPLPRLAAPDPGR